MSIENILEENMLADEQDDLLFDDESESIGNIVDKMPTDEKPEKVVDVDPDDPLFEDEDDLGIVDGHFDDDELKDVDDGYSDYEKDLADAEAKNPTDDPAEELVDYSHLDPEDKDLLDIDAELDAIDKAVETLEEEPDAE